jgi:hydroxymethylpyrimidine/phosphomethylpyrimidine kinase
MRIALSIAGSDPTGGAGLQMDLQVFRNLGVHGAGVISALTIQDSSKVHKVLPVFPTLVRDQIRTLLADMQPAAVKIGMLATDDIVRNVDVGLSALGEDVPVVVDPVLEASDGSPLLERRAYGTLQSLLERCRLVTPNLLEAEQLTSRDVSTRSGCEDAARAFIEDLGAGAVLLKGGHRDGPPDDLLASRDEAGTALRWLDGERIPGGPVHGTGCALSAAIAAELARGKALLPAVERARQFVAGAIHAAEAPGKGARFLVLPSESA